MSDVFPAELAGPLEDGSCRGGQAVRIGGVMYEVRCNDLGAASRGIGTVVTLLQGASA